MRTDKLDRVLAAGVTAIAAFHTLAAVAFPIRERRPGVGLIAVSVILLLAHAALYWFGRTARERAGIVAYLLAQAALVFAVGLTGALFPVGVGLYAALTAQAVILSGRTVGTLAITLSAIVLFATNAMVAQDLYRGASAGLLLAVTGVVAHAIAAVLQRRPPPGASTVQSVAGAAGLTARELEVLGALAAGARNGEIASSLGIAERTVKAHLASVYQKLGVESRGAAVAVARERGLLRP
ncbi:MAG: helix-turn-helix domain-containing protein [Burkholderiales bacterium]